MGASMLNCEESGGLFDDAHAFLRYLEAHKWNTNVAEDKLHATAAWRTAFGVISMRLGGNEMEIAEQNVLGRMHVHGYDKECGQGLPLRSRCRMVFSLGSSY